MIQVFLNVPTLAQQPHFWKFTSRTKFKKRYKKVICLRMGFRVAQLVKNLPAIMQEMQKMQVRSPDQEDPLENEWQLTPVFLPGKFHDREAWWVIVHEITESDMTEHT